MNDTPKTLEEIENEEAARLQEIAKPKSYAEAWDTSGLKAQMIVNWTDDRTVTLDILQRQLFPWSKYNFGDRPAYQPLLGMIEETGETSAAYLKHFHNKCPPAVRLIFAIQAYFSQAVHSYLKNEQQIRGTSKEHEKALIESLGHATDIINAYYGVCVNDAECIDDPWELLDHIGLPKASDTIGDGLADTIVYIADFSNALGIDLTEELDSCWKKVRQRDWVAKRAEAAAKEQDNA